MSALPDSSSNNGPIQWQRAHGSSDYIRKQHADGAAQQHDQQSLGKKLQLDVPFSRSQRPPQADLTDTFIDGDEHNIHHANSADSQCQRADEGEQNLQTDRQRVDDWPELV